MAKVTLIAAIADNNVIGVDGHIPWDIPGDKTFFRQMVSGSPVVGGRVTLDEMPDEFYDKKYVVSSTLDGAYRTVEDAIVAAASEVDVDDPVFVVGGEHIYRATIGMAEELIISKIPGKYEGDRYFPNIDFALWEEQPVKDFGDFLVVKYVRRSLEDL